MKNFLPQITSLSEKLMDGAKSKSTHVTQSIKNKVGIIMAIALLSTPAGSFATEPIKWLRADTLGEGPIAFALKHFQTAEWERLENRNGEHINPRVGLVFGHEYTIRKEKSSQKNGKKLYQNKRKKGDKNSRQKNLQLFRMEYGDLMGLDLDVYKKAIAANESNAKGYYDRNDEMGKRRKIHPSRWAWGKYQFITKNLERYGVRLMYKGKIVEKRVRSFLGNPKLQETIMEAYTKETLSCIIANEEIRKLVETGEESLPGLLAAGHIGKQEDILMALEYGKDWLNTDVGTYARKVSERYMKIVSLHPGGIAPNIKSAQSSTVELHGNMSDKETYEKGGGSTLPNVQAEESIQENGHYVSQIFHDLMNFGNGSETISSAK